MTPTQARRHRAHLARRRRSIRVLRALWRPVRLTTPGAVLRSTAWTLVVGLYSTTWLTATIAALLLALYPASGPVGTQDAWTLFNSLIPALALTFAGIAVLQLLANTTDTPPATIGAGMPAGWRGSVGVFLLATLIFQMRGVITTALEAIPGLPDQNSFPWTPPSSPDAAAFLVYDSMLSGAVEEIIVLAIPVIALRAAGHRWPTILITAVLLRTAFHIYYGAIAIPGHLIWALALALLYIATARIWPLYLAHAMNNCIASLYYVIHEKDPGAATTFLSAAQGVLTLCATAGLLLAILLGSALLAARRQNTGRPGTPARQRDDTPA